MVLEHEAGQLAYRDVVVGTPRQSGQSSLVLALVVYRKLSTPRQRLVYGAQTRLAARTKLFDVWWPRIRRSPLAGTFKLSRATGAETLRCANGSAMSLLSTDEGAAHEEPSTAPCSMSAGRWTRRPNRPSGRRWRPGATGSCGCCRRPGMSGRRSGGRRWTPAG